MMPLEADPSPRSRRLRLRLDQLVPPPTFRVRRFMSLRGLPRVSALLGPTSSRCTRLRGFSSNVVRLAEAANHYEVRSIGSSAGPCIVHKLTYVTNTGARSGPQGQQEGHSDQVLRGELGADWSEIECWPRRGCCSYGDELGNLDVRLRE